MNHEKSDFQKGSYIYPLTDTVRVSKNGSLFHWNGPNEMKPVLRSHWQQLWIQVGTIFHRFKSISGLGGTTSQMKAMK